MQARSIRTRRWSRREYETLVEGGFFGCHERLELIGGLLLVKEPQGDPHAVAVDLAAAALRGAFGKAWLVRAHAHVALGRHSRPEPDVYVVSGSPRDYREAAPTRPALVIEVAESRLRFDRGQKASLYARAGVPDYWIVNLVDRVLEVHREPARLEPPRRRCGYRSIQTLGPDASVSPLAAPAARIAVADLLP